MRNSQIKAITDALKEIKQQLAQIAENTAPAETQAEEPQAGSGT